MSHRNGWIAVAVVVALLFVGLPLGLYAVLSSIYGGDRGRAQLGEVLTGRVANAERLSALRDVRDWANSVQVNGASPVAVVLYTTCGQGQSNWKVHDGYRLQCSAAVVRYSAWTGEYSTTARRARQSLTSRCDAITANIERTPAPGQPVRDSYQCPEGLVGLEFGSSKTLFPEEGVLSQAETTDSAEHYSGPSPTELAGLLKQHQWFVVHTLRRVYFEDKP